MRGVRRGFEGLKPRIASFSSRQPLCSKIHTSRYRPRGQPLSGRTHSNLQTCYHSRIAKGEDGEAHIQPGLTDVEAPFSDVEIFEKELADDLASFATPFENNVPSPEDPSFGVQHGEDPFNLVGDANPEFHDRRDARAAQDMDYEETVERIQYGDLYGLGEQQVVSNAPLEDIYAILQTRDPHAIMSMLIRFSKHNLETLLGLPPTTFTEMLRRLDAVHLVGRYLQLHKEISWVHPMYQLHTTKTSEGSQSYMFNAKFISLIMKIFDHLRAEGLPLSIAEYKYLLRCARTIGDTRAITTIWAWMERDRVEPDVDCFNQYLAAHVWSATLNPVQRYKITPFRGNEFVERLDRANEVMQQVTSMFDRMMHQGLVGDEETYCLMIIAFARTGQIAAFESILRRVWNIESDVLAEVESPNIPAESRIEDSSPLRPSSILLLTLAHAYGINNDIQKALGLVDYLARQYSLDIPLKVWEELVERAYVLSVSVNVKEKLPPGGLKHLWDTLVSEPYNIKPSMYMFDKLIKYHLSMTKPKEVVTYMTNAAIRDREDLNRYRELIAMKDNLDTESEVVRDKLERDITLLRQRLQRNRFYFRSWLRHLPFQIQKHNKVEPEWAWVYIPRMLAKWLRYLPAEMKYHTLSGIVTLKRDLTDPIVEDSNDALSSANELDDLVDDD